MANEQNIKEEREIKKVIETKDGIILFDMSDLSSEESILEKIRAIKEALVQANGEGRVLIKMTPFLKNPITRSSIFRKRMAEKAIEVFKEPGFERAAIFGASVVTKTIASFIINASGLNNMKIFDSREKALMWLKAS